jgi:hypothetical protein
MANETTELAVFNPATPNSFKQSDPTLYNIYMIMFWGEIALLIIFFGAALFHVIKGQKQPFAAKLLALLLVSNISLFICMIMFKLVLNYIDSGGELGMGWWTVAIVAYVLFVTSDACFSVATWMLAFNYYRCSEKLEQVHKSGFKNVGTENQHSFVFWFMLSLNVASSLAWGTFRFLHNYDNYTNQTYTL